MDKKKLIHYEKKLKKKLDVENEEQCRQVNLNEHKQPRNKHQILVIPVTAEPHMNGDGTGGESSVASTPPSQAATVSAPAATAVITSSPWFDDEPVIKSPPEPTRVKSPEQMIMRSPEPVNWTVPLDTGKTFTVTQNVREGKKFILFSVEYFKFI